MNLPVILSPAADREFETAAEWYEEQRTGLGVRFVTAVQDALDRIGQMPELHAVVYRDLRRARVAKFPYNIYYRVLADRVEVLAVVHGRRNPSVWQSRA
jgi:plasmid stabilization system protein ParE